MSPAVRNLFIGFIAATLVFMLLVIGGTLMHLDYVSARERAEEERAREKEPPRPKHNAKCLLCNRSWDIPEEHRGTIAEETREYGCPNCGQRMPAGILYKWAEGKKPGE